MMPIFGRRKRESAGQREREVAAVKQPEPELAAVGQRAERAPEADERRPDVEPLLKAIGAGDIQEVGKLLDARTDVNGHGPYGITPLEKAISRRDSTADEISATNEIVALLLDRSADPNLRSDPELHQTPLHPAAYAGLTAIVGLLVKAGADIDARDLKGSTPLREAAYKGRTEVASLLLDAGADVNAQDREQRTPLHWAAERGRTELAALLLGKGADVNASDVHGRTPLADAAWDPGDSGCTEVAALLLDNGADANARDNYGKTPLKRAEEFGHPKTAALLKQHGAVE
jgi:ankyrin repeat protein